VSVCHCLCLYVIVCVCMSLSVSICHCPCLCGVVVTHSWDHMKQAIQVHAVSLSVCLSVRLSVSLCLFVCLSVYVFYIVCVCVKDHIGSLNFNHKVQLRSASVTYINSYAEFIEPHKIKVSITPHCHSRVIAVIPHIVSVFSCSWCVSVVLVPVDTLTFVFSS